jgi:hypothetical protein
MMYYPIQTTGTAAQFPMVRTRRWKTLETRTQGGHVSRGLQPEARRVHWQLDYQDLSDIEAAALTDLFEQTKGGLESFLFVDPLANLICRSEAVGEAPWAVGGGVSVAPGAAETPAVFQITNSGQGAGTLGQSLLLPPGQEFCLSCWLQGSAGQTVGLRIGGHLRQVLTTGSWQRVWLAAASEAAGATQCAVELMAGGVVNLRSVQLEQQPTPSAYRAGGAVGGVYPETRFEQESLEMVASGPNRNEVKVKLVSRLTE